MSCFGNQQKAKARTPNGNEIRPTYRKNPDRTTVTSGGGGSIRTVGAPVGIPMNGVSIGLEMIGRKMAGSSGIPTGIHMSNLAIPDGDNSNGETTVL